MKTNSKHHWWPQHGFLHKRNAATQRVVYLTGRKTGTDAKSSELSAEHWHCQAALDQMAKTEQTEIHETGRELSRAHPRMSKKGQL